MVQDKRNLLHALVWALIKMLNYKVINIMFNWNIKPEHRKSVKRFSSNLLFPIKS